MLQSAKKQPGKEISFVRLSFLSEIKRSQRLVIQVEDIPLPRRARIDQNVAALHRIVRHGIEFIMFSCSCEP